MEQTMREIMERAIGEMREGLAQEVEEGESWALGPGRLGGGGHPVHPANGLADDANLG